AILCFVGLRNFFFEDRWVQRPGKIGTRVTKIEAIATILSRTRGLDVITPIMREAPQSAVQQLYEITYPWPRTTNVSVGSVQKDIEVSRIKFWVKNLKRCRVK